MAEHIGHGVGAAIQSSVDVTTAAQTRAQRDADKIAKGPRGSKVLFANRQGVGVVLNRHRKAGGFSKFFSHRSACPAWQVVGCVCHAACVIDSVSGVDAEGKRFMSKFSRFLHRALSYALEMIEECAGPGPGGCLHGRFEEQAAVRDTRQVRGPRSEEHTSELQSRENLVCRLLLEKKKTTQK